MRAKNLVTLLLPYMGGVNFFEKLKKEIEITRAFGLLQDQRLHLFTKQK